MSKQEIIDLILTLNMEMNKLSPYTQKIEIKAIQNKIKMLRRLKNG